MTVMEQLAKLEKEFSPDQARILMDVIETQTLTKDYFDTRLDSFDTKLDGLLSRMDAKLEGLRNQMLIAMLTTAGLALGIAKIWI